MQNFELRIRLARRGHCTSCHRAALFTFHSSLFSEITQCGALAIAACSVGHRSALHRALRRAAFSRASFCAKGSRELSAPFQKAGERRAGCFGMMANAEPRTVNFVNSTFFSPLAGMLERIFVNLQAGRTGGAIYVALREDDIGSLIYK